MSMDNELAAGMRQRFRPSTWGQPARFVYPLIVRIFPVEHSCTRTISDPERAGRPWPREAEFFGARPLRHVPFEKTELLGNDASPIAVVVVTRPKVDRGARQGMFERAHGSGEGILVA